jgi:hypothetical protein
VAYGGASAARARRARETGALSQFFRRAVYGRRARASPTIADAAGSKASARTSFIGLVYVMCFDRMFSSDELERRYDPSVSKTLTNNAPSPISAFSVRNYAVQTATDDSQPGEAEPGAPRDRGSGRPVGQELSSPTPSTTSATTQRVEEKHYFAFAEAAFSRAPATMSFNFPCSASTLNKSTTNGT